MKKNLKQLDKIINSAWNFRFIALLLIIMFISSLNYDENAPYFIYRVLLIANVILTTDLILIGIFSTGNERKWYFATSALSIIIFIVILFC